MCKNMQKERLPWMLALLGMGVAATDLIFEDCPFYNTAADRYGRKVTIDGYCGSRVDRGWFAYAHCRHSPKFCFKLIQVQGPVTFDEAEKKCKEGNRLPADPHLASIVTAREQRDALEFLEKKKVKSVDVMIGLKIEADNWSWSDNKLTIFDGGADSIKKANLGNSPAAFLNTDSPNQWTIKEQNLARHILCKASQSYNCQLLLNWNTVANEGTAYQSIKFGKVIDVSCKEPYSQSLPGNSSQLRCFCVRGSPCLKGDVYYGNQRPSLCGVCKFPVPPKSRVDSLEAVRGDLVFVKSTGYLKPTYVEITGQTQEMFESKITVVCAPGHFNKDGSARGDLTYTCRQQDQTTVCNCDEFHKSISNACNKCLVKMPKLEDQLIKMITDEVTQHVVKDAQISIVIGEERAFIAECNPRRIFPGGDGTQKFTCSCDKGCELKAGCFGRCAVKVDDEKDRHSAFVPSLTKYDKPLFLQQRAEVVNGSLIRFVCDDGYKFQGQDASILYIVNCTDLDIETRVPVPPCTEYCSIKIPDFSVTAYTWSVDEKYETSQRTEKEGMFFMTGAAINFSCSHEFSWADGPKKTIILNCSDSNVTNFINAAPSGCYDHCLVVVPKPEKFLYTMSVNGTVLHPGERWQPNGATIQYRCLDGFHWLFKTSRTYVLECEARTETVPPCNVKCDIQMINSTARLYTVKQSIDSMNLKSIELAPLSNVTMETGKAVVVECVPGHKWEGGLMTQYFTWTCQPMSSFPPPCTDECDLVILARDVSKFVVEQGNATLVPGTRSVIAGQPLTFRCLQGQYWSDGTVRNITCDCLSECLAPLPCTERCDLIIQNASITRFTTSYSQSRQTLQTGVSVVNHNSKIVFTCDSGFYMANKLSSTTVTCDCKGQCMPPSPCTEFCDVFIPSTNQTKYTVSLSTTDELDDDKVHTLAYNSYLLVKCIPGMYWANKETQRLIVCVCNRKCELPKPCADACDISIPSPKDSQFTSHFATINAPALKPGVMYTLSGKKLFFKCTRKHYWRGYISTKSITCLCGDCPSPDPCTDHCEVFMYRINLMGYKAFYHKLGKELEYGRYNYSRHDIITFTCHEEHIWDDHGKSKRRQDWTCDCHDCLFPPPCFGGCDMFVPKGTHYAITDIKRNNRLLPGMVNIVDKGYLLKYQCDKGYHWYNGTASVQSITTSCDCKNGCQVLPKCQKINCTIPEDIEKLVDLGTRQSVNEGEPVDVICPSGTYLDGGPATRYRMVCDVAPSSLRSEWWQGYRPKSKCTAATFCNMPTQDNADVRIDSNGKDVRKGENATFRCRRGWRTDSGTVTYQLQCNGEHGITGDQNLCKVNYLLMARQARAGGLIAGLVVLSIALFITIAFCARLCHMPDQVTAPIALVTEDDVEGPEDVVAVSNIDENPDKEMTKTSSDQDNNEDGDESSLEEEVPATVASLESVNSPSAVPMVTNTTDSSSAIEEHQADDAVVSSMTENP